MQIMPRLSPLPPHPDDVARAAAMIDRADKIIIMAGLGAAESGAAAACRLLAERCNGLLATTLPARGLFHDDPFCVGVAGGFSTELGRRCFADTELVIAVGCSIAHHNADGGKLWPNAQVLHLDLNPMALNQGRVIADHHMRADARLGAEALANAIQIRASTWRSPALAHELRSTPADSAAFSLAPGLHLSLIHI